jgi:hydrogenase nickel incorporation protein HypA/HybF
MHELALARAILATARDRAEGRRVVGVEVSIGALRQVVPSSLAFNFEVLARGSDCDGATLEQRLVPARLRCECGGEWALDEPSFLCPRCGSARTEVIGGQELRVESIEVEVEEETCTAPR